MGINRWINTHFLTLLKIWVVIFTVLSIYLFVHGRNRDDKISEQARQNTQLIKEIQKSRVQSCITNYNVLLHAFDPFKPKADDPRTPRNEVGDFKLFTNNLTKKRSQCKEQVAVKPKERNAKP